MQKSKSKIKKPISNLGAWYLNSSTEARELLLSYVGISYQMLRQWVSGRRNIKLETVIRFEDAMKLIQDLNVGGQPPLDRGEFCELCRRCPHYVDSMLTKDDLK